MNISGKQLHSTRYQSFSDLNKLLLSLYPQCHPSGLQTRRSYLDTVDRRIARNQWIFELDEMQRGCILRLRALPDQREVVSAWNSFSPQTCRDLESEELRDKLTPIMKNRAFIATNTFRVKCHIFEIENRHGKITCRIAIERYCRGKSPYAVLMTVSPLRGYEQKSEKVTALLKRDYQFSANWEDCSLYPLLHPDNTAPCLPPRGEFELDPQTPAREALSSILLYHLDVLENNEAGIIEDIDAEFLHDFRIAGRYTRSLVSQVKDVYPPARLRRFMDDMRWLSRITSTHRDLDVFLWDLPDYIDIASTNRETELEALKNLLMKQRSAEHRRLVSALKSRKYERFKQDWRKFLEVSGNNKSTSDRGNAPILLSANLAIRNNYRKLLRQGRKIEKKYAYNPLHNLRKTGKKLRYLINTFESLYPEEEMARTTSTLKKLQNNLGKITDMHTQRELTRSWSKLLSDSGEIDQHTLDAIGEIEKFSHKSEKKAARNFKRVYREFSKAGNQKLFTDIFR